MNPVNQKHTDIRQRAKQFSLGIIAMIDTFSKTNHTLEIIPKQLLRSATSVGANIVEAQAGSSKRDFANFINYALKSANETVYWLEIIRESGKARGKMLDDLLDEAAQLAKILGSSMLRLRGRV